MTISGAAQAAESLALRFEARRVALANAAAIAVLTLLGVLHIVFEENFGIFDLNGERNAPATYSAALWTALAVLAALLGRVDRDASRTWRALSVPLLLVAADEFGEIHERLERITGIDWQILYSPLGLVAVVLWVLVGRRLRRFPQSFALFVAGTACGVVSQIIEAVEYGPHDRRVAIFDELSVAEELFEMTAAVLIGLALLGALRAVRERSRA